MQAKRRPTFDPLSKRLSRRSNVMRMLGLTTMSVGIALLFTAVILLFGPAAIVGALLCGVGYGIATDPANCGRRRGYVRSPGMGWVPPDGLDTAAAEIATLRDSYARGLIDLDTFERRVGYALDPDADPRLSERARRRASMQSADAKYQSALLAAHARDLITLTELRHMLADVAPLMLSEAEIQGQISDDRA